MLTIETHPGPSARRYAETNDLGAELVKHNQADNLARFYRVAIWPDLFGGVSLAREYGRIGQPGLLRLDPYNDEDEATRAMRKLVSRKTRRGYQPIVQ